MTVRQIEGARATLSDVLRHAAAAESGTEAFVEPATATTPRRALTFADWDRAAASVAGRFAELGVERGSVVCLRLPSSITYMVCYAAAARLGAVTSGINPRLGEREVRSILDRTRPDVLVDEEPSVLRAAGAHLLGRADVEAAADGPPGPEALDREPDDPVAVVWTSGTTGLPKGAVFDHRNLRAVAAGTDPLAERGDRRLSPLPFSHVGSMTRLWDEAGKGITTVITPTPWRAVEAIAVMAAERITVAQGVPTQWALVLACPELAQADLSALRVAGTGAARVPAELVAAVREALDVPVVVRYTSTEASLGTGTLPGDPDEAVATSVGTPVPGVQLEVTGDDGRPVPDGEVGRVRLSSAATMRGYWGGPATGPGAGGVVYDRTATDAVLGADGWLTTGDFGFVDGDGRLHLAGRANELYIRGGYNVYPAEVEAALGDHPDVAEIAVVGAPDPVLGEIGVAFVVPEAGSEVQPDALLGSLRERACGRLADYKAPDRVVVVDQLPVTSMLKVDKRALADRAALETNGVRTP